MYEKKKKKMLYALVSYDATQCSAVPHVPNIYSNQLIPKLIPRLQMMQGLYWCLSRRSAGLRHFHGMLRLAALSREIYPLRHLLDNRAQLVVAVHAVVIATW